MDLLFHELKSELIKFRNRNKVVISNYLYQNFLNKKIIASFDIKGILFFIYDAEYKFYKMYFMVLSHNYLKYLLEKTVLNTPISLEIIYKKETKDNKLEEALKEYGFSELSTLKRMSMLSNEWIHAPQKDIKYCEISDLENIKKVFRFKFNKYTDSLPSTDEIFNAINNQSIIKLEEGKETIGFLWFENKSVVSEIKYIYIAEEHRGEKFSIKLMNQYFYLTKDIKKKQLWVIIDNNKAINLYKKFGYKYENLKNKIFIR